MRTAGVVFSVVAVLAGVVVARLEYDREKTAGSVDSSLDRSADTDAARVARPSGSPGVTPPEGAGVTPPAGDATRGERTRPDETSADARIVKSPSDALRRRHKIVESLVASQQF